jgi:hypothetical protein
MRTTKNHFHEIRLSALRIGQANTPVGLPPSQEEKADGVLTLQGGRSSVPFPAQQVATRA